MACKIWVKFGPGFDPWERSMLFKLDRSHWALLRTEVSHVMRGRFTGAQMRGRPHRPHRGTCYSRLIRKTERLLHARSSMRLRFRSALEVGVLGSVVTKSMTPMVKRRRRLRAHCPTLPMTNSSSTFTRFTTHGASARSCLETSLSLSHTSPTARSFTSRWQGNYRRLTPRSVRRRRRRRKTRASKRNESSSWWREPKARGNR